MTNQLIDQLHVVRRIAEKFWEFDIDLYQLFVDFKQAYDSVDREKFYKILLEFDIPAKLVRLIRMSMEGTVGRVKVGGGLTEEFGISQGLKQEDGLAPMLFNLALEYVVRKTRVDEGNCHKQISSISRL